MSFLLDGLNEDLNRIKKKVPACDLVLIDLIWFCVICPCARRGALTDRRPNGSRTLRAWSQPAGRTRSWRVRRSAHGLPRRWHLCRLHLIWVPRNVSLM